jgi:mRNA deadenylase 3'-5' endonuclease subunit Ccr4
MYHFIAAAENGALQWWGPAAAKQKRQQLPRAWEHIQELEGHTAAVNDVAFSGDGTVLISGADDGTCRVWDLTGGAWGARAVLTGHTGKIKGCDIAADGSLIVTASNDKTMRFWNTATTATTAEPSVPARATVNGDTTADGTDRDGGIVDEATDCKAEALNWRCSQIWQHPTAAVLRGCALSPCGTRLAAAGAYFGNCDVRLLAIQPAPVAAAALAEPLQAWEQIDVLSGHDFHVWSVAWSPCGQHLASGSADRSVRLWSVDALPPPPHAPGTSVEVRHDYEAATMHVSLPHNNQWISCECRAHEPLSDCLNKLLAQLGKGGVNTKKTRLTVAPGMSAHAAVISNHAPACDALRNGRTLWLRERAVSVDQQQLTAYNIRSNTPTVLKVQAPRRSPANLPVVVSAETVHADAAHTRWRWWSYNAVDQPAAEAHAGSSTGSMLAFRPPLALEGAKIVCECTPCSSSGRSVGQAMSTSFIVEAPLPPRPWLQRPFAPRTAIAGVGAGVGAGAGAVQVPIESAMTVVSFNVLADLYVSRDMDGPMFGHCAHAHLHPNYRERLVLDELVGYNADIICLQEVEWWSFEQYLEPSLRAYGFHGRHDAKHGQAVEGCAIFYQKSAFTEVYRERISMKNAVRDRQYADLFAPYMDRKETAAVFHRITTVAQLTLLRTATAINGLHRHVLVINTHLFFHPSAPHVRNITVAILLRAAARIIGSKSPEASVLFCGDFNSHPATGVVELLLTGTLPSSHTEWQAGFDFRWHSHKPRPPPKPGGITAGEDLEGPPWWESGTTTTSNPPAPRSSHTAEGSAGLKKALKHPFKFTAAHDVPSTMTTYTNYTPLFRGTLDYILAARGLEILASQPPLPTELLATHTALPSVVFPSDHVAVVTRCRWGNVPRETLPLPEHFGSSHTGLRTPYGKGGKRGQRNKGQENGSNTGRKTEEEFDARMLLKRKKKAAAKAGRLATADSRTDNSNVGAQPSHYTHALLLAAGLVVVVLAYLLRFMG